MDISKTRSLIALGISGVVSIGTANAEIVDNLHEREQRILAISTPDMRVTVYDGIATVVGTAKSKEEALNAEKEIIGVDGVDHVVNLITWP